VSHPPDSLSAVFPPGTLYFYGFPAGEDSAYYNNCPPALEELVAMRAAACAGAHVGVVAFAATTSAAVWGLLADELGVPLVARERLVALPAAIDHTIQGAERNRMIKQALRRLIPEHALVMAQPYLGDGPDDPLARTYRFPPALGVWCNDKRNIPELVPAMHRIPEYGHFADGQAFCAADPATFECPCVVKLTSSGAGDGVRICLRAAELAQAQRRFAAHAGTIVVQKYIERAGEFDVKFAVPFEPREPCALVGHSQELTGRNGEYMASLIRPGSDARVADIYAVLEASALPQLRARGWYGVGGVDVLIDRAGDFYFSDFNCRMTASMAQTLQLNTGVLGSRSTLTFYGRYRGPLARLRTHLLGTARFGAAEQLLNVIALADDGDAVRIYGGVLFDQPETLREHVAALQRLGIDADVFARAPELFADRTSEPLHVD
jgi:hypothetical protein